ncbi:MAG: 3-isopropylmalate dehydratase small subunit [Chromatocurvus sp.]
MQKFQIHRGVAAPLLRNNVDTDAVIPSREMKRVSKTGLGEGLFAAWRYTLPGGREPDPDFVLNQPAYRNTSILLSGSNFGCGSSREHAVWALAEFGIRAIIASSFGSIFYSNCIRNGILPIVLEGADVEFLAADVEIDPQGRPLLIDLPAERVITADDRVFSFSLQPAHKHMLLEGLDGIALTLQHADDIAAFEQNDRNRRPWVYL